MPTPGHNSDKHSDSNHSNNGSGNNALSARHELLLQKALDSSLTNDEEQEFASLLARSAVFAEEYHTLVATKTLIEQAASQHSSPDHSTEYWQGFNERVLRRVASELLQPRFTTGFWLFRSITSRTTPKAINALKAAILLVCGFALGWIAQYLPAPHGQTDNGLIGSSSLTATNTLTTNATDVREFLQQSHLLLLGMMNLSGECRVTNPESLLLQRQQSFVLLFKARQLKRSLPAHEHELTALLTATEHALAVVAALHPATLDANSVREVQTCSGAALCEISSRLNKPHPLASLQ